MNDPVIDILEDEDVAVPERAGPVIDAIRTRHGDRVLALLYYGSSGRESDDPSKMLDFYVLVDSYRLTHGRGWRAFTNRFLPPAVYYIETDSAVCKYSILSISEFEKRCGPDTLLSQVWGRFSQPTGVIADGHIRDRIQAARATAIRHLAGETKPLFESLPGPVDFWARGYHESYRTELRPEAPLARSREIVERFAPRYGALFEAVSDIPGNTGASRRWFWRRVWGKPMTAMRVLNSAATFDGGLDYVLRKVHNHSGVTLEPTPGQRRHPVLWSPVLAWKLWRQGAFR